MKKLIQILYDRPILLFLLFTVTAYLPVLLPFFHLKNDILTQNLPTRFVFSESLHSGFEPFWNPYLHFGTPQYGDMNNGFWNPVQWIIGATTGYNIYTITFEELFYIFIGGWGAYKVCKEFLSKDIALITGFVYMTSGYVVGHLQYLCWLTGVGYFPYVLLFFLRINKNPIIKNFILGGGSVFLFVASTHPGLIIGAIYFFIFLILVIYFNRKDFLSIYYHPHFWRINFLFLLIASSLSFIVIFSNLEVLQHISRGSKVSLEQALLHPTTPQSYISLFLPLPVHKTAFFNTDIGMRNTFIGVLHFLGLFLAFRYFSKRQLISIIIPLLFFILLSAGGFFKTFAWKVLPLLGYVRLNGEFTYFVILLLLLSGAGGIEYFIKNYDWPYKSRKIFSISLLLMILILLFSLVMTFIDKGLHFEYSGNDFKQTVKNILDNISFWELLLVQTIIHAITLLGLKRVYSKKPLVGCIVAANLIITTWFTLPFTGLGMMSKREVQKIISTFPKGIHPQPLVSIINGKYISAEYENQLGLLGSYSKKIGYLKPDQYPVQLNNNNQFISDTTLYNFIKQQAFIFLSSDTTITAKTNFDSSYIRVIKSGAGYVKCIIHNSGNYKWLTLLQNNYPHWEVRLNGKLVKHFTTFKTFISVPVSGGYQEVEFKFNTSFIYRALTANLFLFVIAIIMLLLPKTRNRSIIK